MPFMAASKPDEVLLHDIETTRLQFRRFTPDDLHALAAIRSDPDVMKYVASRRPESIEEVQIVLDKVIAHCEHHGFAPWALIDKVTGKLAGWCGFRVRRRIFSRSHNQHSVKNARAIPRTFVSQTKTGSGG